MLTGTMGTIGKILYYILSNIYNLYQITQNYFLPLFNPKYWLSLKHGGSSLQMWTEAFSVLATKYNATTFQYGIKN